MGKNNGASSPLALTWLPSRSSWWIACPLPLAMSQTQYWLREGGRKVWPPSQCSSGVMPQPNVKEAREW